MHLPHQKNPQRNIKRPYYGVAILQLGIKEWGGFLLLSPDNTEYLVDNKHLQLPYLQH